MTETPHSLIERLLAEEDKDGKGRTRLVAELSARAAGQDRPSAATAEMIAARLEGHSDEELQGDADAVFAVSSEALNDLVSAAAFLDAVGAERRQAPSELVAAAVGSARPRPAGAPARRPWVSWRLVGAGIGLALAALAAVVIIGRQAGPSDPAAPMVAQPKPSTDKPAMVPAGSEEVVPVPKPGPGPRLAPDAPGVMPGPKR